MRSAAIDIAGMVEGASVWDLCCGSGAFGIECLSAGALGCVFVDIDAGCTSFVKKALETLGGIARSSIIRADVISLDLSLLPRPDIVFVDPPYRSTETYRWAFSTGWGGIVRDGGIVMVEAPAAMAVAEGWTLRRYGETSLFWKWFGA